LRGPGPGVLGRFLEISLHAPDVPASLDFYRRLGLAEAVTGDVWDHHYGVVTDGALALGLHAYDFPSPALTWVCPGIPAAAAALEAAGVALEFLKTGDERFNELGFLDPDGQMVTLLEARTFSPPSGRIPPPAAGFLREYRFPVRVPAQSAAFWETLGFVALEATAGRVSLTGDGITLAGYESARRDAPGIVFETPELQATGERLTARGLSVTPQTDPVEGRPALSLTAPEGTPVVVLGPQHEG
jgi:catechol 2,3-dioxygenase-like lactoylglutathione lyase family enzyme